MTEMFQAACEQAGYRVDAARETVSGLVGGVAFRVTLSAETVELSVNLAEKRLPKLQQKWQALCEGLTVTAAKESAAVTLHCPSLAAWDAARLNALLETVAADAVAGAEQSFSDRHEKERDPWFSYLFGAVGALLGAVVGALPWFLVRQILGWDLWFLAAAIGVASFYGYRLFCGAHATGYATAWVVVSSLLIAVGTLIGFRLWMMWEFRAGYAELYQAWWMLDAECGEFVWRLLSDGTFWQETLSDVAFPLIAAVAGLCGIRRQILVYTHEGAFLRRGHRRR